MTADHDSSTDDYKMRHNDRVPVDGSAAQLTCSSVYSVEVKIRNVSTSGFMAECQETVGIGSFVSLDVPGVGPVQAQVRWQVGKAMGGMFVNPISLDSCEWTAVREDGPRQAA